MEEKWYITCQGQLIYFGNSKQDCIDFVKEHNLDDDGMIDNGDFIYCFHKSYEPPFEFIYTFDISKFDFNWVKKQFNITQ